MENSDTNNDDTELLLLDKLLSDADNGTKKQHVPKLVEDKAFYDAFSYEVDNSHLKSMVTKTEEVDSSDEEEVKNFLERKFNEYGTDINKKLKQQRVSQHEVRVEREVNAVLKGTTSGASGNFAKKATSLAENINSSVNRNHLPNSSLKIANKTSTASQPLLRGENSASNTSMSTIYTDPIFGLRIINPLISSTALMERMSGRKSVSFAAITFHIQRGDLSKDWVIAGVVVSKSPVRQTKTGQPFSIWRLSDLRGEVKMVSLFLFKGAHKDLWKTAVGMCIAILNPAVLEKRAEAGDAACLSIDTAHKVLVLGQSKDMGVCKAKKKDGAACTVVVNLRECDYCIYHMKQEYTKMSRRSELQSETAGRGLNELRNKVLGKSEVFYGGQSFTAIPAKKSTKLMNKDKDRMSALAGRSTSTSFSSVPSNMRHENKTVPYAVRDGPISRMAGNVEATSKQRQKDVERLKILQNETIANDNRTTKTNNDAADIKAVETSSSTIVKPQISVPEKFKNREFSQSVKTLKSFNENISVEINMGNRKAEWGKLKAVDIVKKSPIQKSNPNSLRGSLTAKRRAIDELNDSVDLKRQKLEDDHRELEKKSRIQRIMDATSSHRNLIDMREQQDQDQYFNKLEKKEALEEKLLNTYKVPCKAVICIDCNYTAFSASDRCKQERHRLKVVDAEKRFFQCKDCSNRTATVFRYPKVSCKNCSGSRWERAAVIRGKTAHNMSQELSIRGNEETFIGTLSSSANLNLLVPDE